jgi:hypothetical protein
MMGVLASVNPETREEEEMRRRDKVRLGWYGARECHMRDTKERS